MTHHEIPDGTFEALGPAAFLARFGASESAGATPTGQTICTQGLRSPFIRCASPAPQHHLTQECGARNVRAAGSHLALPAQQELIP